MSVISMSKSSSHCDSNSRDRKMKGCAEPLQKDSDGKPCAVFTTEWNSLKTCQYALVQGC